MRRDHERKISKVVSTSGIPKNRSNEYSVRVLKRLINDTLAKTAFRRAVPPDGILLPRKIAERVSAARLLRGVSLFSGVPHGSHWTRTIINCPEKARLAVRAHRTAGMHSRRHARDNRCMHACMRAWVRDAHTRPLARSLARAKRVRKRGDLFTGGTGST